MAWSVPSVMIQQRYPTLIDRRSTGLAEPTDVVDRVGGVRPLVLASGFDVGSMLDFPDWTAQVFVYAGLCLLLLGLMAWFGSHRIQRRTWGRRLTLSGGGLFVVGSAFGTVLDLLRYVLG